MVLPIDVLRTRQTSLETKAILLLQHCAAASLFALNREGAKAPSVPSVQDTAPNTEDTGNALQTTFLDIPIFH